MNRSSLKRCWAQTLYPLPSLEALSYRSSIPCPKPLQREGSGFHKCFFSLDLPTLEAVCGCMDGSCQSSQRPLQGQSIQPVDHSHLLGSSDMTQVGYIFLCSLYLPPSKGYLHNNVSHDRWLDYQFVKMERTPTFKWSPWFPWISHLHQHTPPPHLS